MARLFKVRDQSGQTFEVEEQRVRDAEKDGFLPVVSNGMEEHRVSFADLPMAEKDGFKPVSTSDVGMLESGVRGLAQGATFGFADEIAGGVEAAFSDKSYEQARDESRANFKEAQEANPWTYGAGNVGGAIATTALLPGLGGAATVAGRAGQAALGGAIAGAGTSEGKNAGDVAQDAALGAGLGAGLSVVGDKVLSPALKKAGQYLSDKTDDIGTVVAKKAGRLVSVPEEATERYLSNPSSVNNAMTREELGESLIGDGGALEQLRQKVSELDALAWQELGTSPKFKKDEVIQHGKDFINEILKGKKGTLSRTAGTGASNDMIRGIQGQLDEVSKAYGDALSESDLKSVIQDLQKLAYGWEGSPKMSVAAEGIRSLSGRFNDVLKKSNTSYAAKMEPVAETTRLLKSVERNFINRQDPSSMDKFLSAVPRFANKSEKSSAKESLAQMDKLLGTSMKNDLMDSLAKESFSKANTNGSRNTLIGTVLGSTVLPGPGSVAGAAIGYAGDKYAGRVFKAMLDGKIAVDKAMPVLGSKLGKYAKPLMNAASRGNKAVAATHFLLSQRDPEYRKAVQKMEQED